MPCDSSLDDSLIKQVESLRELPPVRRATARQRILELLHRRLGYLDPTGDISHLYCAIKRIEIAEISNPVRRAALLLPLEGDLKELDPDGTAQRLCEAIGLVVREQYNDHVGAA